MSGFHKTDLGVSSAEGAGNTQIGIIMRIAVSQSNGADCPLKNITSLKRYFPSDHTVKLRAGRTIENRTHSARLRVTAKVLPLPT